MLTDADKEYIELFSEKLAYKVVNRVLITHVKECPVNKKLTNIRYAVVGVAIGLGITIGGGGGWQLIKNILASLSK